MYFSLFQLIWNLFMESVLKNCYMEQIYYAVRQWTRNIFHCTSGVKINEQKQMWDLLIFVTYARTTERFFHKFN